MSHPVFDITGKTESTKQVARLWLYLGLFSLVAAGLFSLLLVLSRTPFIQSIIPGINFFHIALVVHVDLSVLIWFLSFTASLWSLSTDHTPPLTQRTALGLGMVGTCLIILSPFLGADQPIINNYVPVLNHPLFLAGLVLFSLGIVLVATHQCCEGFRRGWTRTFSTPTLFAPWLSSLVVLLAMTAVGHAWLMTETSLSDTFYYEVLFWGGGHILQFSHTLLMLTVWVWLIWGSYGKVRANNTTLAICMLITVAPLFALPWVYSVGPLDSGESRYAFTQLMKWGGLASLPLGVLLVISLITKNRTASTEKPLINALIASLVLFLAGGVIGFLIEGVNVVIPAHYHGSIVGVTLSFMGMAYFLFPRLGLNSVNVKWATRQPFIYGGGQLMHILGLAWSGGYGVQRKTAGAAQGLERLPEILGMGMMGLGGLISIIGGIIFLLLAYGAIRKKSSP